MLKTPENVALSLVHSFYGFNLTADLPNFHIPTLVIHASHDGLVGPAELKTFANLIPGAEPVIIEALGHFLMLENPQAFDKVLNEFLSAHKL